MAKHTFIEFVGNAWLNGKAVAAYRVDVDTVQLRGETTGGKIIGQVRNVSSVEFEALKEVWFSGVENRSDARVVDRGLSYLGVL